MNPFSKMPPVTRTSLPFAVLLVAGGILAQAAPPQAAIEADLVVGYAPSYANSVGGDDNVEVILANAVAGSNRINEISGTGAAMRIAGFIKSANDPVNWTTTGGIVGWLANNDSRVADVVAYGTAMKADLVTYVVQSSDSGSIAAVAQQPGVYSSYNPSAVWSAVFAHETGGHNYGRSHSDGVLSPKTVMLHNYCGGGAAPPYYFSNPNIVSNGVLLRGTGDNCGQGSLINGGDNSSLSARAVADRAQRAPVSPRLSNVVRRWLFNQAAASAPAGTTVSDTVSGATAVVRGTGATFTGSALRTPGGTTGNTAANSIAAYIDLPNGLLSSRTNITIEVWATPLAAASFARILDFGRTVQAGDGLGAAGEYTGTPGTAAPGSTQSSDSILLSACVGTDLNAQRFEAKLDGTATQLDSGLPTTAGVPHHYVVTFAAGEGVSGATGGRWRWYRDGEPIAFVDVAFPLSSMEDVNNWLGRSLWSGDAMVRADFTEVRISDVALSRAEVLANYELGPLYNAGSQVTLAASDASGASSFNTAGSWSNASAPSAANAYETFSQTLRTPTGTSSATFAGSSLRISGGRLVYAGTGSGTATIANLVLNAGELVAGTTYTLAGGLSSTGTGGVLTNSSGALTLSANLAGSGPLTTLGQSTRLTGTNTAFTGKLYIGNGSPGILTIDSQARLGTAPASFVSDQLTLNRGTLATTATLALDATNRGILLDVSGGTFNVASGTTLTISSRIATLAPSGTTYFGSLGKSGAGTLILAGANTGFQGLVYADTSSTSANDGILRIAHPQALVNARSPIYLRNNNGGSSILQLDGTAGAITQTQRLWMTGRTTSAIAVQNLTGTNTLGGLTVDVGGSSFILQSDAGTLRLSGSVTSAATGARTLTFQGAGSHEIAGGVDNGSATVGLTKAGTGTLLLSSTTSHSGATTLSGGTLRLAAGATLGTSSLGTAAGTTLTGLGTLSAGATISGTHAPGSPNGVQTLGGTATYNASGRLRWTLLTNTAATTSTGYASAATVSVATGAVLDLALNEAGTTVDFRNAFWLQPRSWPALVATAQSGTFALGTISTDSLGAAASAYGTFSLSQSATGTNVVWTPKPFLTWTGTNFAAQATDTAVAGFDADPDGDGLTNGIEFLLGDTPLAATRSPLAQRDAGNRLALVFTRNTAATDVVATVQAADTLAGPWTDLASSTGGAPFAVIAAGTTVTENGVDVVRTVEVQDPVAAASGTPTRFLRLVVVRAP